MSREASRRPTTQVESRRLSHVFWILAGSECQLEVRDPEQVVAHWLRAVDGLEGRRKDPTTTQNALSFLLRLEKDAFYASPEQTRGGEKDSRALVYTLGLFLFEKLTGHHPFVESLSPLECRIQRDRAKRVGKNNLCHLPKSLRRILTRSLSAFPDDRQADTAALRLDLEAWLREAKQPRPTTKSLSRGRTSTPPPFPQQVRKRPPDTLQGAVAISKVAETQSKAAPRPWLWPSISVVSALVAATAMLVAVKAQNSSPTLPVSAAAAPLAALAGSPAFTIPTEAIVAPAEAHEEEVMEIIPTSEEQIVSLIRECVPNQGLRRGVNLGISIRFDEAGVAQRSFTGKLSFSSEQSQCIKEGLGAVTANEDQRKRLMSYDIFLSANAERIRARRAKH